MMLAALHPFDAVLIGIGVVFFLGALVTACGGRR